MRGIASSFEHTGTDELRSPEMYVFREEGAGYAAEGPGFYIWHVDACKVWQALDLMAPR